MPDTAVEFLRQWLVLLSAHVAACSTSWEQLAGRHRRQDGVASNDSWQQGFEERTCGVGLRAGWVAGLDDLVDLLDVVAGALEGFGHDAAVLHYKVAQHLPNTQQALEP
jgi:hypothetical protein